MLITNPLARLVILGNHSVLAILVLVYMQPAGVCKMRGYSKLGHGLLLSSNCWLYHTSGGKGRPALPELLTVALSGCCILDARCQVVTNQTASCLPERPSSLVLCQLIFSRQTSR